MAPPSAFADLISLRAEHGRGLYASGGELYKDAISGRDAAQTADDVLHLRPDIAREGIRTLSSLQGLVDAPIGPKSNEEERGDFRLDQAEGVRRDGAARQRGRGRGAPLGSAPSG